MSEKSKPVIRLELSSGCFRIPTTDAVYEITVCSSPESTATMVIEQIVDAEQGQVESVVGDAAQGGSPGGTDMKGDDYYKRVSTEIYHEIGVLAKSLTSTMLDIPAEDRRGKRAELDEAGEKIEDAKSQLKKIVDMTEQATMEIMDQVEKVQGQTGDVKEVLAILKDHQAFKTKNSIEQEGAKAVNPLIDDVRGARDRVARIKELILELQEKGMGKIESGAAENGLQELSGGGSGKGKRYLFSLDTIFQTLYEFCTNEAVKTHISSAREHAAEIFEHDLFIEKISLIAEKIEPDADNFIQISMSEILGILKDTCSDKAIKNLFKNMDANQSSIFIDQSLPLELPEIEKASVDEQQDGAGGAVSVSAEGTSPMNELVGLAGESLELLDGLAEKAALCQAVSPGSNRMSMMTLEDQADIFQRIEDAFNMASGISVDTSKITEVLSFQDLSGQQIMKIIKLLNDFQVQLLAIVVSFGSQLKVKEKNSSITAEEGKRMAQEDVDLYVSKFAKPEEEESGMLDQDEVNAMLEEMGF
ncbi:MAG: protein phosphatase CheZ [Proteobacteria bacterium]|nr:protein phosphatase CheZ [Pseudomonadota bacterium]MBU1715883.1 protein phosphatase CheZ [Pseudomonadota bacterium]